jgi:hypothetical protein
VLTVLFPLKAKMSFSSRFAYVLLQSFPTPFTIAVTPKRRPSGAKPLHSAAEAAPHHSRDLLKRGRSFIMH